MDEKTHVLASACDALVRGAVDDARAVICRDYPFAPEPATARRYGPIDATRVFVRDGFRDRYTGGRLVFPPVLRLLSLVLPDAMPYHPNWKTSATHPAFWELGATVDHLVPVARGGADDPSNWVTTSMARNGAKQLYTLEELGWTLHPPGDPGEWDGLLGWFIGYTAERAELLASAYLRQWHRAALAVSGG